MRRACGLGTRAAWMPGILLGAVLLVPSVVTAQADERSLAERLTAIETALGPIRADAAAGRTHDLQRKATRLYLDEFEAVEGHWGPHAGSTAPELGGRVVAAERAFHDLMRADAGEAIPLLGDLEARLAAIRAAARRADALGPPTGRPPSATNGGQAALDLPAAPARSPEIVAIVDALDEAERAWRAGDRTAALAAVEHAYLEGFEPLEPRLSGAGVSEVERTIHLELRPALARGGDPERVAAAFARLDTALLGLDRELAGEPSFWMGAVSSFAIIVREGLEAVLLIGAILAYLSRVSNDRRHSRQVWAGVGLGVAASVGTWVVARTLIPVGGASRELIEGVTALVAVAVLLYVSHWLFQKTYIHDWKEYLRGKVGAAVGGGSALAMAGLAFAAVYREGFETVLFYQALLFDSGASAVLAGFVPGLVLIVAVGAGILKLGLQLPLKKVFGVTNAILLYLAFVFLGKGLYNLQEAGLFAAHPVGWMVDHPALRQILGLYPVAETLLAQTAFLVLLAGTYVWYRRRAGEAAPASRRESSGEIREPRERRAEAALHDIG